MIIFALFLYASMSLWALEDRDHVCIYIPTENAQYVTGQQKYLSSQNEYRRVWSQKWQVGDPSSRYFLSLFHIGIRFDFCISSFSLVSFIHFFLQSLKCTSHPFLQFPCDMTSFPSCPSLDYLTCSSHYTFPVLHLITQSLHISLHDAIFVSHCHFISASYYIKTQFPLYLTYLENLYTLPSFFYASNYTASPLCNQLITLFLSVISFQP